MLFRDMNTMIKDKGSSPPLSPALFSLPLYASLLIKIWLYGQ